MKTKEKMIIKKMVKEIEILGNKQRKVESKLGKMVSPILDHLKNKKDIPGLMELAGRLNGSHCAVFIYKAIYEIKQNNP